ncbi:hypothetical protein DITRI_Ditri10aG0042800 [Diplodiscus trichospermus]
MAVAIYQQLKRLGLKPNDYTYGILIKALCKKGSWEEAVDVFREMDEVEVRPNLFAYTTYIEGLCMHGTADLGYEVLRACRDAKIPLVAFTYCVVIRGLCNKMKFKEAEDLLFDAEKYQNKLCVVTSILQSMCQMGLDFEAVNQRKEFRDIGIFPDEVCHNVLSNALCKVGKVEEAVELLDEMIGKLEDALNLFEEMKEKGHNPDIVSYSVLAGGLARNGLVREAINLLSYVESQGLKHNTVIHNMIIKGLCIGGKVKEAEAFLDSLAEKCFENYAALMYTHRCILSGRKFEKGQEALDLFNNMKERGIKPDVITYTVLLKRHTERNLRTDNLQDAIRIFDEMIDTGMEPDNVTYTALISGYFKRGNVEKAVTLVNEMSSRGIQPDIYAMSALHRGILKAKRVVKGMDPCGLSG